MPAVVMHVFARSLTTASLVIFSLFPAAASADEQPTVALNAVHFEDGTSASHTATNNALTQDALEAQTPPKTQQPAAQLLLSAHAGLSRETSNTNSGMTGLTGLVRLGPVVAGGFVELQRSVFDHSLDTLGAAAGFALGAPQGMQFNALLVGGRHSYDELDGSLHLFGSSVTGDRASLPFIGTRLSASYSFGQGTLHFQPGAMLLVEQDLMSKTIQVTRTDGSLFGQDPPQRTTEPFNVAARLRVGLGLSLGVAFDL